MINEIEATMTDQPTRRLRVTHVIVQPVLVWDDGDNLEPGPVLEPQQVPDARLGAFAELLPAEINRLAEQYQPALHSDPEERQ